MEGLNLCGKLKAGLGYSHIYCDVRTGDVVYDSDIMGACLFSNISVVDPLEVTDEVMDNIIKDCDADGVIMSETYLIVLKDNKAEFRKYDAATVVTMVVDYDLDMEYDRI